MKLGASSFLADTTASPAELAMALEAAGFESFFCGDHSHIPYDPERKGVMVDTRTGQPLPLEYAGLLEPFVALGAAAAATNTLRLGTSICLINERDTIATAKAVGSLDYLSGGRFIFGIGAGWNEQEMLNHGANPKRRYRSMREKVEAMTEIWSHEVAEYHGEIVDFPPIVCGPKPLQKPRPPILIGGNARNIPRIVAYADGWIPSTTVLPAEAHLPQIRELKRQAEEAGRSPIPVTGVYVSSVKGLHVDHVEFTDEMWGEWERAGIDRTVILLPKDRDSSLRMIERYARFSSRASDEPHRL